MKSRLLRKMSSLCSHGKQHLCENLIAGNEHTDTDKKVPHAHFQQKVILKNHKMYIV